MWSSGPRGRFLTENRLFADSALHHIARTIQRLLMEFWIPADWLPYSPDVNLLDFAIWCILQAEVQATPRATLDALCLFIAAEWDHLVAE
jgi:hypothetical protein